MSDEFGTLKPQIMRMVNVFSVCDVDEIFQVYIILKQPKWFGMLF